jgi:HEAT repeat protein
MSYRNLYVAALLSMALVACSKDGGGSGDNKVNPNEVNERSEQYKETYRFILNGCDTEKHDFSASSAAEVKKQLCEALQNVPLNKGCAEPLRRDFFEKKCSGYAWNPIYEEPGTQPNPANPQPQPGLPNENLVRNALKHVLVNTYQVATNLGADLTKLSTNLSENMTACGLSYVGPKCLNYSAVAGGYEGQYYNQNGDSIFLTDLRFNGWNGNVLLAFKVKESPQISSEELTVYLKLKEKRAQQTVVEYLADKTAVQLLSTLQILTQNVGSAATQRLQNPQDLKELYHLSQLLKALESESGKVDPNLNKFLIERFAKNSDLFSKSLVTAYQYSAFEFLESLSPNKSVLIGIADALLKIEKEEIKQFAAAQILSLDKSRVELKSLVLSALEHKRSSVRIKAIKGLSAISLEVDEQNKIILKMDDSDYYVREAAYSAANGFTLKESQIPTLKKLLGSSYTGSRKYAAMLVGKIGGQAANTTLIGSMSDADYYVREEVYGQLDSRSFTDADLPELKKQMQSSYTATRKAAARLIGKIGSENANNELINNMSDADYYVREDVYAILQSKTLTDNNLTGLKTQIARSYTATRKATAGLLGKIGSDKAITVLINAMSDADYYVREAIYTELDRQKLKDTQLQHLTVQLDSSYTEVRKSTAKLVGKINGDASIVLLIKNMSDSDYYVREQIFGILDSKSMNGGFVSPLNNEFSSSYTEVRKQVAKLLGKIKTPESLNALKARLAVESDYYVKEEIKKSVQAVGG